MSYTLQEFLSELDEYDCRVPLDDLTEKLQQLDITLDDLRDYLEFNSERYRRNLLKAGSGYQALVLCWRSGQRSPIHDHRGSSCGVRVLTGVATETIFDRAPNGMIHPTSHGELRAGDVCGSQDSDIHQVSNLQPVGEDLVTLHIYSPPLLTMNTYSLTDSTVREFEDPIFEFCHGAGI